jgi:hypothetical protein
MRSSQVLIDCLTANAKVAIPASSVTMESEGRNMKQCWIKNLKNSKFQNFILFFQYIIQHFFICCPSDSTVSEDAGIQPRIVATWHCLSDALTTRLDLIHNRLDLIHSRLDLIHSRLDFIHNRLYLRFPFQLSFLRWRQSHLTLLKS